MKKLGAYIPILLTIVLTFSIIANVNAATVRIQPATEDTYIEVSAPNSNYGTIERLRMGQSNNYRTLIKFDLSAIPSGATVESATLSLYLDYGMSGGNPTTLTYIAYLVTEDWTASEATWNHAKSGDTWGTPGGVYDSGISASATGSGSGDDEWFNWDVTEMVSYWVSGAKNNYGFLMMCSTSSGVRADFHSSDYSGDETTKPILEIVYSAPGHPVGGIYAPNDKLSILAPYIALVGLIGTISSIFAIRRWRKD